MEWISNVLVLEKLVLIENAAQIMVMKYMQELGFFCQLNNMCSLIFFSHMYQGHVWYHFGLPILRVCCLYTMMKKNSHLNVACETTSSLNLKLVCCKFQLYKCMYGLKCYQLYHVLPVCRLFLIKNVYSSIFSQLYHDLL